MPQIIPMKDLRNTNAISKLCHERKEPVFVTKNGYSDLVVMSTETYDKIIGIAEMDAAISASETEISLGGELMEAKDALGKLRRKHFG